MIERPECEAQRSLTDSSIGSVSACSLRRLRLQKEGLRLRSLRPGPRMFGAYSPEVHNGLLERMAAFSRHESSQPRFFDKSEAVARRNCPEVQARCLVDADEGWKAWVYFPSRYCLKSASFYCLAPFVHVRTIGYREPVRISIARFQRAAAIVLEWISTLLVLSSPVHGIVQNPLA